MSSNNLTVIESSGSLSLLTDGINYYLRVNGGQAVELSYNGSPVTVGEFAPYGDWTPIAAMKWLGRFRAPISIRFG